MSKKQGRPKLSLFFLALGTVVAIGAYLFFHTNPLYTLRSMTNGVTRGY